MIIQTSLISEFTRDYTHYLLPSQHISIKAKYITETLRLLGYTDVSIDNVRCIDNTPLIPLADDIPMDEANLWIDRHQLWKQEYMAYIKKLSVYIEDISKCNPRALTVHKKQWHFISSNYHIKRKGKRLFLRDKDSNKELVLKQSCGSSFIMLRGEDIPRQFHDLYEEYANILRIWS